MFLFLFYFMAPNTSDTGVQKLIGTGCQSCQPCQPLHTAMNWLVAYAHMFLRDCVACSKNRVLIQTFQLETSPRALSRAVSLSGTVQLIGSLPIRTIDSSLSSQQ